MTPSIPNIRKRVREFDFSGLFIEELGWDRFSAPRRAEVDGVVYELAPIAEKRGFQVFRCSPNPDGTLPDRVLRQKIDGQVAKQAMEHLIVYTDRAATLQQWQWALREPERPVAYRENHFQAGDTGQRLAEKLQLLFISIDDEERLTLVDVSQRVSLALRKDRVTKKFYERFDKERKAFLPKIDGIADIDTRDWYASIMLNRLMFVYFVQKKGFLNNDPNYLRNKLTTVQQKQGRDQFYGYYREFLLKLFHEGLAKQKPHSAEIEQLLGDVPYLNGGIFDIHQIEQTNPDIRIPDEAFETIFAFFDSYDWHLDDRALRDDQQINPDVLGYIFEKYINQKQMGAYYTKEDITEYISKNTIVPFLFDAARKDCAIAFRPDGALWGLLQDNPDRYIYDAVQTGVRLDIPPDILAGKDDVAKRGGWNRPAADGYGLPTETWREYMARRDRYCEIRDKLLAGEVTSIDDLITYNLDIRQFAQDVIQHAEGPELVRAVFEAIREVSVLDPTCGSGAFLFAALNILHPLYDACLERMEEFVDALNRNPEPQHPQKYSDFKAVLAEVDQHASRDYYILKTIIARNLYGVDIMEEAVEICKLRLFLKLASKLEQDQPIEPLPDIDFNIRAGNTLVGFTSIDDVRRAALMSSNGNMRLALPDDLAALDRLEEQAVIADRAFAQFREQQTTLGGAVTAADKANLRSRLRNLSDELDRYLARLYGIFQEHAQSSLDYQQRFTTWRESHQPFHWLIDFYGIMQRGGFDVIIGNPPYVELNSLREYRPTGYSTEPAGNLYALMIERSSTLGSHVGRQGFIVPVSSISTDRYLPLQSILRNRDLHYSSYDDRPSRLFDGLEHIRLTIHLIGVASPAPRVHATRYHKWSSDERQYLFQRLDYIQVPDDWMIAGSLPKLTSSLEQSIVSKLQATGKPLASHYNRLSEEAIFYSRKVGYFLQVLDFQPTVLDGSGNLRPPSEFKELRFSSRPQAKIALAALNANLFYWFVTVASDCRHVNKREVDAMPIDLSCLQDASDGHELVDLAGELMTDIQNRSQTRTMKFRHDQLTIQTILPKYSKPIIDEIDRVLAKHYGFTDEELDFIINYDIKYRMGRDGLAGDEAGADGDE